MPESNEPREIKVRYSKKKSLWMTLGVIVVIILSYVFKAHLMDELENRTIDLRFFIRGPRVPKIPIKIVAVDEKSLKEIGQWPWPRAVHAQLIRKLKEEGVKAVFYDVFFPEPERAQSRMLDDLKLVLNSVLQGSSKSVQGTRTKIMEQIEKFRRGQNGDQELEKAMKETNIVFIPLEPRYQDDGSIPKPESLKFTEADLIADAEAGENPIGDIIPAQSIIVSIPGIANSVRDSGHTRGFPNRDGVYRYYPTVINYQGKLIPHLSLQVARFMLNDKNPIQVHMGKYTEVAGRKIPILDNGMAMINYCGDRNTITTISASDVLSGRIPEKDLKGCLVEVGATADGLFDLRPTPYTKNSPGVEINANIVENVFTGNFLWPIAEYLKYLLIVMMAMAMWYFVPRLTPFQATIAFFLILAVFVALSCLLFSFFNTVITMAYPLLALLLTFIILTTYKFRTDVKHARYMKQMFQSVVSPKVVEEILDKGVDLAGEEKELTVMFSDIRGFTTFSEKHTPHEVVDILNEYLTQMTLVLLQTEGTLDKYIGDAIMAFWGAPGNQQDHAYRACSTALGMVDLLHSVLHPKWELEGKEKLDIGIGLNTGKIVVGYVGSQFTKNYTLIGDPVNLGSRLEGTTKEYKVEIIISETTFEYVKMDMLCRELDLIQVKGKTQPIRIYELVDHRLRAAGMKEMKVKAFEEGLAHYRACRFDEAEKRFKNCLELDPKDGPAHIFLDRCKLLAKNPPATPWNGVFVMKSK